MLISDRSPVAVLKATSARSMRPTCSLIAGRASSVDALDSQIVISYDGTFIHKWNRGRR